MQPQIEHVSDTALMVAGCRALETQRPDALVQDPFAAALAGERGMALANASPRVGMVQFGVGMRCRFIDELLRFALSRGVDTVLNLGAGLDTRPWRLDLPAGLRWIEVDFPEMLEYKAGHLADATPRCHLERISADLNQAAERDAVLESAVSAGSTRLLMTEGLLMYLPAETLQILAGDARARGFRYWLLDVSSPELMRQAHGDLTASIERVRAEEQLSGKDILDVAARHGWTVADQRRYIRDGASLAYPRMGELSKGGGIDPSAPPPIDDVSGVWLYEDTTASR